jgi:hypothetical protein
MGVELYALNAGVLFAASLISSHIFIKIKTKFAYETFQEIADHLSFVLNLLRIPFLGSTFSQVQFIFKFGLCPARDARP